MAMEIFVIKAILVSVSWVTVFSSGSINMYVIDVRLPVWGSPSFLPGDFLGIFCWLFSFYNPFLVSILVLLSGF